MKKSFQIFICFILFLFISHESYSQGLNAVIALDNINVFAAGNAGKVFRSSNGGTTWAKYTIGSIDYKCASAFGNDVWVGGSDGKVYKTTKINSSVNSYATGTSNPINGIWFVNSSIGFACAGGGLVYKTVNGGINWSLSNSGIPAAALNSISFRDANYGVVVGDNGKIFMTDNGGGSWASVNSGVTRNLTSVEAFSGGTLITGEWGTILSLLGTSITPINSRTTSDIRGISGSSFTDAHIVGGGGFIRNNKNGSSDFLNFEINPMLANLVDVSYLDPNTGYAISSLNDAIIKTTNGGQNWQLSGGATMNVSYSQKLAGSSGIGNGICPHPFKRDVIFVNYGRNIYRSPDKGDTWVLIASFPASITTSTNSHSFFVSGADTNVFMVACENAPTDRVIRSTDYGLTWNVILNLNFTSYGTPLEVDHLNPSIFYYAPDGGGFWKSTNNGANFVEISGSYPFRSPCDISIDWENPNIIFLADGVTNATQPAELFKSTNGGVNWTKVHTNPGTGGQVSEIPCIMNSIFDKNLMYITTWSGSLRFKSTNAGDNWFGVQSTSFSGWTADICREDPTVVLTGSYSPFVSLSTNGSESWSPYNLPSGGSGAGTYVQGRDCFISQQGSGLLKMSVAYTVITNVEEQTVSNSVPAKYNLLQNYPNPFNPVTEIKYDIKNAGDVKLNIYNQEGKNIYSLVNGYKNAGTYSVKFDASAFASGVYFYTLESGGNIFTKKMALVK
ncbi:MAG: T9SS type A sorting domain-containing protein [Ignavibacteria bacterium]|nr:T9SS type A sorting domain-containing protein [Ignavibacteria bacterium]